MDDIEREAIRDEGYDPDDPALVAAIDMVRAEVAPTRRLQTRDDTFNPHRPIFLRIEHVITRCDVRRAD